MNGFVHDNNKQIVGYNNKQIVGLTDSELSTLNKILDSKLWWKNIIIFIHFSYQQYNYKKITK